MHFFKPADHSRRTPAVLQAHTKENIVAQLTLTAVFLTFMWVKELVAQRRWDKELKTAQTEPFID